MITVKQKGNFKKLTKYLKTSREKRQIDPDFIGHKFVEALKKATPVDTGLTAESWRYRVTEETHDHIQIVIENTNIQNGVNVALLLNYGHVAPNGTWVEGANFLEPALQELYIKTINNTWKEIENL